MCGAAPTLFFCTTVIYIKWLSKGWEICGYIICCCITNYSKTYQQKRAPIYCPSVCVGQESSLLSWVLCFGLSDMAGYPPRCQPGCGFIWKHKECQTESKSFLPAIVRRPLSVPGYVSLFKKASCFMKPLRERERDYVSKVEVIIFQNLITEATSFHSYCIFLIPSNSLGPACTQRKEYQEGV